MPRTLLVVDDNGSVRAMLNCILSSEGYEVINASNGHEALDVASTLQVDGALVDVDMPDMNGFEFCRALRKQSREAGADVLMWIMTGEYRADTLSRALAAGALTALRKPFKTAELFAQLERQFSTEPPHIPARV